MNRFGPVASIWTQISGTMLASSHASRELSTASFTAVSNANGYEWRQSRLANLNFVDGAENGLTNFIVQAATNLYNVRDSAVRFAGSYSFHLTHTQTVSQILQVVETLPKNQREVIYLKFQSDLSYKEISEITRLSVTNVGFLIHSAVRAIRKQMLPEVQPAQARRIP